MNANATSGEYASSSPARPDVGASPKVMGATAGGARPIGKRPGSQYYDAILWRCLAEQEEENGGGRLLGLTSCGRQSGVTTLATNLATRAADHDIGPVLLVDGNVGHPQLHRLMNADRATGLADVLTGEATLGLSVQATAVPDLQLLRLGTRDLLNHARVDRRQLQALVSELRESYAAVFVDLPEAGEMEHMLPFARKLDATLLVIRAGRARRHHAQHAIQQLSTSGVRVAGAVVTGQHQYVPNWLQHWL
jgi:Mrp family chromosome partitioning ATPase